MKYRIYGIESNLKDMVMLFDTHEFFDTEKEAEEFILSLDKSNYLYRDYDNLAILKTLW